MGTVIENVSKQHKVFEYFTFSSGLYGYSWNMMINSWQPILTSIKVVDNVTNQTMYMDPNAFTENNRWSRYADMAQQYAHCIHRNLANDLKRSATSSDRQQNLSIQNLSIYLDVWCSMNSRFQQRVFDPRVDILHAPWSPWRDTDWVLPLLTELTDQRPHLMTISEHVFGWSNYSDVLFIADFPGLSLDNYVAKSADNVSLTVLDGAVIVSYASEHQSINHSPVVLHKGQSTAIRRETFHNILVVSDTPATYMYTYTNGTAREAPEAGQGESTCSQEALLPLWEEAKQRWSKFEMFFHHVLNSILFQIYGVPMPVRVRDRSSEDHET